VPQPQTYANHVRFEPAYHFVMFPILLVNAGWSVYRLLAGVTFDGVLAVAVAVALVILALYARVFALRAQDRIIRLEMQLRMRELLPDAVHSQIGEFTPAQFVALRFASDAELPTLAARVLADNIQDRRAIKQMISSWKADHLRV